MNSLDVFRTLQKTGFWLLAIAGGIIAIHLSLSWRRDTDFSHLSMSVLGWVAVLSLLWERRNLNLESDFFSSLLGWLLIAFFLLRSLLMTSFDTIFDLLPFIAALGVAMLASGINKLQQYWQELLVVLALNAPLDLFVNRIGFLAIFTAKFSTLILTYLGVQFYSEGIHIFFSNGKSVEVAAGCSGWESIFPLLKLSVLFLVMVPTKFTVKILVPLAAVAIAFVVNGVRVAMMAILVAYSHPETFDYWHKGTGSQIFFSISTLLFSLFCYLVIQNKTSNNQEQKELSQL